jgi:short-subunit dehydrogenase
MLAVLDTHGIRFDMVLNVAGCDFEGGFLERDREKLVKIVLLNNAATLRITHALLKRRRQGRPFSIVFVSSLASMFPMPLKATYAASKRFLLEFATALRQELRKDDVNVLTLCPAGMVTTEETLCGIKAQGFWGNVTTAPLEDVARRTIDCALAGKGVYTPGLMSRLLSFLGKFVPRSFVAAVVYRRWHHAQRKWMRADIIRS